ncbi:MAG: hypothetical protein HZA90_13465 [Verrucomicrobia bacterium]|nr:hypothetical protein [Verrucomicrobiota bacterium]
MSVNLSATDNAGGSGVKEMIYSASGAQRLASTTVPGASAVIPITREGTTTITYRARDHAGNLAAARTVTVKLDKTPPVVVAVALPALLRPADHRLVNIRVTVGVVDLLSGANGFTLVSVTSSEPDSGTGGGDVPGDIVGWALNTADRAGQVRAERSPTGRGRVYTLRYEATDKAGNKRIVPAFVAVPR